MPNIATLHKNSREELRVALDEFRGHELVSLRVWFRADDGEMRPGRQGVAIRKDLLPDLLSALQAAAAQLKKEVV